ncbi:helix-turn-helix domain-containing protein [Methylobacterium sp. NEAU 140]|uniref:helix-turn-helix domain-containing protein n=1 Tax=Methylobacterium sp. NEAU 140 TaxID=3064945 RepID=UPI002734DE06|nr:helix-turn-helix domain-containing protein [Methylobacterium sp. NEAU 140]MDP4026817.1 helix-turn-helix domain-containing protein [Methylobacterium sp. NEAU 140]
MTTTVLDPYAYPPIGMNREAAARYVGVTVTVFDMLVMTGWFPKAKDLGGMAVWDRIELEAAFRSSTADDQATSKKPSGTLMSEDHPGYHNVYTPDTLAERWKCSRNLVRNLIQRKELEAVRYGPKMLRITAAAVIAYEQANLVAPCR